MTTSTAISDEPMLTAPQAARHLGVPVRTFYGLGITCYRYGPRCNRWALSDLEDHKRKCRFTSTKKESGGYLTSRVELTADVTDLRNSFRRAGAEPRQKLTTDRKALVIMLKQPD